MKTFAPHPAADAFPLMTDERFAELIEDIQAHGLREAITICDGKILDGRNRFKACEGLGIEPETREFDGDPWAYVWSLNGERRDLSDLQRGAIRLICNRHSYQWQAEQEELRKQIETEANRKRSEAAKEQPRTERGIFQPVVVPKEPPPDKHKGRAARAAEAHVSPGTQAKVEWIANKRPDLLDKVARGDISGTDAIREIKRAEVIAQLEDTQAKRAKELHGTYDAIVIDPPWPMQKIERDCRPNQSEFDYPTMSEAELAALEIPAADDCHIWLWTTHKFMPMAFRLLDAWQLKYVCTFVWHKPGGFQPIGLPQYNCEFALYARKGSPQFIDTKSFSTCFEAPRGKHSEKPATFYDMVRLVTAGRRLDMFNRRLIDGFDGWGKEAV